MQLSWLSQPLKSWSFVTLNMTWGHFVSVTHKAKSNINTQKHTHVYIYMYCIVLKRYTADLVLPFTQHWFPRVFSTMPDLYLTNNSKTSCTERGLCNKSTRDKAIYTVSESRRKKNSKISFLTLMWVHCIRNHLEIVLLTFSDIYTHFVCIFIRHVCLALVFILLKPSLFAPCMICVHNCQSWTLLLCYAWYMRTDFCSAVWL